MSLKYEPASEPLHISALTVHPRSQAGSGGGTATGGRSMTLVRYRAVCLLSGGRISMGLGFDLRLRLKFQAAFRVEGPSCVEGLGSKLRLQGYLAHKKATPP